MNTYNGKNLNWITLTTEWSSEPTLYSEPIGGEIYLYTYNGFVLYRYISSDGLLDAYYIDSALTELVVIRE